MFPIQFQSINNNETQGFSVRLELFSEESKDNHLALGKNSKLKDKIAKTVKMTDFQFSFSPIYKKFVRELKDDESKYYY